MSNLTTVTAFASGTAFFYLCLVRVLRWRRYHAVHKKYASSYESRVLTPEEAQEIVHVSSFYDMPLLMNYSLAFALFKTYGIPSISRLLAATKELGSKENVARRYADTEILISTWVLCPISGFYGSLGHKPSGYTSSDADPRAMIALARVNWIHSHFKISNDDFLYTLSLFVFEPSIWAARYGWRSLSPLESFAYFVFWSGIGRKMGIKDIPETMEALKAWSLAYEEEHMVPSQTNKDVAGYTTDELLFGCPEILGIKQFLKNLTICLLEDRVRIAMIQPTQPWFLYTFLWFNLRAVAFIQRWFCLPRSWPKSVVDSTDKTLTGTPPRMHPTWWMSRPWYKKESKGFGYLSDRLKVCLGLYTEMPGKGTKSKGYRLEEMGPIRWENGKLALEY